MPEEKKKESFTFSEQIKRTQANGMPKAFANRFTSKIGSDGKPRQTLFERTKRDAPFFIAAMVALLLLPFLYKYSGQVEEDTPMVSPGYEDAIINPDRSGFDFGEDADGQISQLSGRDSMDLIVGLGKKNNEEEQEGSLEDFYNRSGFASDSSSADSSYKRSDMNEEENITNIYRRQRKTAPAQTRAAFRRANTKINALGRTGMTRGNGGRLGVTFGGAMKSAANRVRSTGPVNSTKPVSLQPLQSAGKPSRSYFGNGAAAEARRSKDAMSKGNAMQALMDAQMKPVEPGTIGGITGGDFGGPGGGNGNLHREFNYNGKEPWWWDLMKTRAQKEWELWFDLKKDWINFSSKLLQTWTSGILNCLVTGNSDGDPDTFLGSGGTAGGKAPECCGMKEKRFKMIEPTIPFTSDGCKAFATKQYGQDYKKQGCPDGWQAGHGGGEQHLTGWQMRKQCLGKAIGGSLVETSSCRNMKNLYQVEATGEARDWNTYIYVVARNYVPETSKLKLEKASNKQARSFLCTKESDDLKIGAEISAGAGASELANKFDGKITSDYKTQTQNHVRQTKEKKLVSDMAEIDPENPDHGCVIYLQKGDTFNYDNFQANMIEQFTDLLRKQGMEENSLQVEARNAFNQLDLMFIESFSAKKRLAAKGWLGIASDGDSINLPMMYWRFYDAYVRHQKTSSQRNSAVWHLNVDKRKLREEQVNYVMGDRCFFNDSVSISCEDATATQAVVTFKQGFKGGKDGNNASAKDITVTAQYTPWQTGQQGVEQKFGHPTVSTGTVKYEFSNVLNSSGTVVKDLLGTITWKLYRGGEMVDHMECNINMGADVVTKNPGTTPCTNGEKETFKDNDDCEWEKVCNNGSWSELTKKDPSCPKSNSSGDSDSQGKHDSKKSQGGEQGGSATVFLSDSFQRLSKNPLNPTERKGTNNSEGNIQDPKWNGCRLPDGTPLLKLDNETRAYMESAKRKFDDNNKDQKVSLSYNLESLTVPELVDAILIDPNDGTVPANTVCLLGKTIGGNAAAPLREAQKDFDNLFGAFLAFITYDAASRPAKYTYNSNGTMIDDLRFKYGSNYWWGGYTDVGDRSYYVSQIDNGVWKGLPLAELARDPLPNYSKTQLKQSDNKNRKDFQRIYDDLTNKEPCKYPADKMVQQAKVLDYVSRLCENGANVMPQSSLVVARKYAGQSPVQAEKAVAVTGNWTPTIPAKN